MNVTIGNFLKSIGAFFSGSDNIPWCGRDIIAGCEREVAEAQNGGSDAAKDDSIMGLSWALVHSRHPKDVQRGIAMLEVSIGSMVNSESTQKKRKALYLLGVGHYRSGDCSRGIQSIEKCLEIAPGWSQALNLKKVIEHKIAKDGIIGIAIAASAGGVIAGGIALLTLKN